jgi:hypothetical protein
MGKRFAIVIGVAGAGVMALGAQTALAGGESVDSVPPELSGPKKQELGNAVKVKASCSNETCDGVLALGHLRNVPGKQHALLEPAGADLDPGETATLKLKLTKKTRRQAGKALDEGNKVLAKVTVEEVSVEAVGFAPRVPRAKRTIRLVK